MAFRLVIALLAGTGTASAQSGQALAVSPDGPLYTISEALQLAQDGDVITVQAGYYAEETLVVDKSITIQGEGWPIVDGEGQREIIQVTADNVSIRGLDIRNAGISFTRDHAAVKLLGVRNARIENNRLSENFFGIYLDDTRDSRIIGNQIHATGRREANSGNGIHIWKARNIAIEGNEISGHRDGVYLEFAEQTAVRENVSHNNLRYGLHFMFSNNCQYADNTFRHNGAGVAVMYSHNVDMLRNTFEDNWGAATYGLLLKDITDSRIQGNRFVRNTVALHTEGSSRVDIRENHFEQNGWAAKVMSNSQNNLFEANNFIDNTFDVATNARRNPNIFRGNYWSAYDGYDVSGDGIGDVAHRPVRLYSLIVEQQPASLMLLRSFFVDLLDLAERVIPALTPETLVDNEPMMREIR